MKAVIIAESENIIEEFSQYYKENGYDIIVYRWLMKAMDNDKQLCRNHFLCSIEKMVTT